MPFKPGEGRPAFNISESEIRYAMENSKSCASAARFLKVSYESFRKYAKLFKDSSSGKTLFELHKNKAGKGISRAFKPRLRGRYGLLDILEGKYPEYPHTRLKHRLKQNAQLDEICDSCGYCDRRVNDYTVPLLLDWMDGDRTNHLRDNLRLLCYNCYYQEVGNPLGGRMKNNY